jgi:hypothetical protein
MNVTSRSGACHSKYSRTSSISCSVTFNMVSSCDQLVTLRLEKALKARNVHRCLFA